MDEASIESASGVSPAIDPGGARQDSPPAQKIVIKPALATMGEPENLGKFDPVLPPTKLGARKVMMGDDPALPKMSAAPTVLEFFEKRFHPHTVNHMLQSAALAQKSGADEKIILACLLHDIAIAGLVSGDHGYWGAQLIEPYVDEEVSWAVRHHQALRFFPDPAVGYEYPQSYIDLFGADYRPEPYIRAAYDYARGHKWYDSARLITLNDLYSFDPDAKVDLEAFADVFGRHFRQPKEGLGFDGSPVAHMWRSMIWPRNFL